MTITIPTPSKHWLLYPLLVAAVVFAVWLWRDTAAKDLKAMQELVQQAKTSQKAVDSDAVSKVNAANDDLKRRNSSLQKQLADAKTVQQQVELINKLQGTTVEVQAQTPSDTAPTVTVSPQDVQTIAVNSEQCAEDKNQVAVDQIQIAAQKQQIEARDNTIAQQSDEIKSLKGSHLKNFLKAAKHVAIGGAIGVATGIAIEKANGH